MTNVAVIGAGAWGKNLVRTFSSLGVLAAVCDANPETLKSLKKQYPALRCASRCDDLWKDKGIAAVVIAAPAALHYSLVKEALSYQKHVFVEKPLSLKVAEGKELVALARKNKRILMVGHVLQYHNAILKLKELIDAGVLGKIQYIYSNRLNIGKIRNEENILWSFAPHDISVILMLLGESPKSIHTTGGSYLQRDIVDVTLTTLQFKSKVRAHIFVSWLHPFKEQKLIVVGSKKMAVFDDVSKEKLFLYPHQVKWVGSLPVASKADAQVIPFKMEEPLRNECAHFLKSIRANTVPKTDGEEGLRVLEILQLSQDSLNSGKMIHYNDRENKTMASYFVHESSYVDENVSIGEGTQIWHFSHILKGSRIGRNCKVGQNVMIGPNVTVGNNCKIQNNVSVYQGVTLEDNVFCGPSVVFTNVMNPRSAIPRMTELKKTLIKKGVTIGANATVLCGITLGRFAFIGAGAVVTQDVPDYALIFGNTGTLKGWMCECGVKLNFRNSPAAKCAECGKTYKLSNGKVTLNSKK